MSFENLQHLYKRYEIHLSSIGLVFGTVFSWYTMHRIDRFAEHVWILIYLALACIGIIAINTLENRRAPDRARLEEVHFWLVMVVQFAFGALFSSFFVFYFRSSSFLASWPFIALIIILLVLNEIFKTHYARLSVQAGALFLSVYLYFIFLFPIWAGKIGQDIFLAAGTASIAFMYLYLIALSFISGERLKKSKWFVRLAIGAIFAAINIMYFTNTIPPIPLSLTKAGAYHGIYQDAQGKYVGTREGVTWRDYVRSYTVYHRFENEPVYVFTAVFSPTDFAMKIVHQWQYYDASKKTWVNSTRITLPIVGGSDNGYRTYSLKQGVFPGMWRVSVETPEGQVLGRVKFEIVNADAKSSGKEEKL